MFNVSTIIQDAFIARLTDNYRKTYGQYKAEYNEIINWSARMALENLATGDALYHNMEHTIYVTLVGQEILRGKHIRSGGVSCEDWFNFSISLLCHDIGYVKGVCSLDNIARNQYATGIGDEVIALLPGASGASLTEYHVDRGKMFIEERFGHFKMIDWQERWSNSEGIDIEIIKGNIELSRFPVPHDDDHKDTTNYAGLLRGADLIGQLSDPQYINKTIALFFEFEEIGMNQKRGYKTPADLQREYPKFFWNIAFKCIQPAIHHLEVTQEGRSILANLYAHVFMAEHKNTQL